MRMLRERRCWPGSCSPDGRMRHTGAIMHRIGHHIILHRVRDTLYARLVLSHAPLGYGYMQSSIWWQRRHISARLDSRRVLRRRRSKWPSAHIKHGRCILFQSNIRVKGLRLASRHNVCVLLHGSRLQSVSVINTWTKVQFQCADRMAAFNQTVFCTPDIDQGIRRKRRVCLLCRRNPHGTLIVL